MNIPAPQYSDGIRAGKQTKFAGLNRNEGAGDGELWSMKNLCSDWYPLLATRQKRLKFRTLTKGNGIFALKKLCWVDGTDFYYDGVKKGEVEDSMKTFASIGKIIIIAPDMKYYNTATDTFGSLGASWTGAATFRDGTIYGESANANTIYAEGVDWSEYFREGDAVNISGCETAADNISAIIREISGEEMHFYEDSFTNATENAVTIERQVPVLEGMLENENRLWGYKGATLYASKLGDPFNFYVYDGVNTDSYTVDSGSAGDYVGCIQYLGYPTFFKENRIFKIYGSLPSNFELLGSATLGLDSGSGGSLAIAGEALLYLSRTGMCIFTGGIPSSVNRAFGLERYKNAVAGSDGLKYYVSMQDEEDGWHFFVYDTQKGLWHEEDDTHALGFAYSEGNLYFLNAEGEIWITGTIRDAPEGCEEEENFQWTAEFGDFTDDSPNKKDVRKLLIRMELDEGAQCRVWLQLDSDGTWYQPQDGTLEDETKRSYFLAIVPRRADHYRLKLEGTGGCRVYSIAREFSEASEYKSLPGRQ